MRWPRVVRWSDQPGWQPARPETPPSDAVLAAATDRRRTIAERRAAILRWKQAKRRERRP